MQIVMAKVQIQGVNMAALVKGDSKDLTDLEAVAVRRVDFVVNQHR